MQSEVQEAQKLTIYATLARYPGLTAPVTEAHYNDAVKIAEDVIGWASSLVP